MVPYYISNHIEFLIFPLHYLLTHFNLKQFQVWLLLQIQISRLLKLHILMLFGNFSQRTQLQQGIYCIRYYKTLNNEFCANSMKSCNIKHFIMCLLLFTDVIAQRIYSEHLSLRKNEKKFNNMFLYINPVQTLATHFFNMSCQINHHSFAYFIYVNYQT